MFYIFLRTKLALHRPLCARFFLLFTKSYLMGIRLPLLKRSVLYFYELLMSRLRRLQRHNCPHLKGLTYDLKIYVDNAVVEVRTTKTTIVDSEVQCKKAFHWRMFGYFLFIYIPLPYLHFFLKGAYDVCISTLHLLKKLSNLKEVHIVECNVVVRCMVLRKKLMTCPSVN